MTPETWALVDRYIEQLFVADDPVLSAALESSRAAGLPEIQVSPSQGKLLGLLARLVGARRILEIGTLGGYSAIWLARALPEDGELLTLELEEKHARVARENLARAGLQSRARVRVGPALESLGELTGLFDFVFVDADKQSYPDYFVEALRLTRPGGLIVLDNVVRAGAVLDEASADERVQGVRRFNEICASEKRVTAIELQTVGSKGYDGFAMVRVDQETRVVG